MKCFFTKRKAGLEKGPASTERASVLHLLSAAGRWLGFFHLPLLLLFVVAPAAAQSKAEVKSSLLGVSIGASLDQARSKLAHLGTGDGRDTRDGGRKEAWTLKETEFATVAFKTDGTGKIVWISAFVRPGKEISFAELGDLAEATNVTKSQAIWSVASREGGYRLVAKGVNGKASVVYLLSLDFPEVQ